MKLPQITFLFVLLISASAVFAQTFIEGKVVDKTTKTPISYANIYIKGTTLGTTTNDTGYFQLKLTTHYDSLTAAFLGYKEISVPLLKKAHQIIVFELGEDENMLAEAVIYASSESFEDYLIRNILSHKDANDKKKLDNYSYKSYNKIELDIKNFGDKLTERKILKPFSFIFNNIDSTSEDEPFLPMMLSETLSEFYYTNKLHKKREIITASKVSGVEDASFSEFLGATYQDLDIYDNQYNIIQKQFISPIANSCKTFYKYKVIDTLVLDNVVHYKMMFEPKTKGDYTFYGSMIVSENNFAIKDMQLRMAPHVNINFIKRIELNQKFDFVDNKFWMITDDNLLIEFRPLEKKPAIVARRNTIYKDFRINQAYNDSVINKLKEEVTLDENTIKKDAAFWDTSRYINLSKNEAAVYHMIDTLKTIKAYKAYSDIIQLLLTGYYDVGPVELGPILNVVSNNRLEGWRFRMGIQTSESLVKWMQAGAYLAYALKDKRFKYGAFADFLIDKFPRQTIGASYIDDVGATSRTTDLLSEDNFLNVVIRRKKAPYMVMYMKTAKLNYTIEYKQGMSLSFSMQNRRLDQGTIPFNYVHNYTKQGVDYSDTINHINQTEFVLRARWGFGEKFINKNSLFRSSLNAGNIPVLQFEYVAGIPSVFKSQFTYHKLTIAFSDIIKVNTVGRFEMRFQAGKVFGKVPFLLSEVHLGNDTYIYTNTAFNLMNPYEFYSDQYLQWNFIHHFDGFFLNRIPGIRKLKLREVIQTRGVWGSVTQKNMELNAANSFIHPIGKVPYIEVGFGLENILKFLRWDVMWRVTHRDNSNAPKWLMTVGFNFNF